jgi:hypothetical protein
MSDAVQRLFFRYARVGRIARFSRLDVVKWFAAAYLAKRMPVAETA